MRCFFYVSAIIYVALTLGSCKKFVEVDPPITQPIGATVYNNNSSAAAALTGIYDKMVEGSTNLSSGRYSISILTALSADELVNHSPADVTISQYYSNSVQSTSNRFWNDCFKYLYAANAAIEGLTKTKTLSTKVQQQLLGEAMFIRAFLYFYLTNLFGDLPLLTETDYQKNAIATRVGQDIIYKQIVSDLEKAIGLLSSDYLSSDAVNPSVERARPNKWAATALLARVYLYVKDYADAEKYATKVIDNSTMFSIQSDLNSVFLANSPEAIWQLQPIVPGYNTFDGNIFILTSKPTFSNPVSISPMLISAFENGDFRLQSWVGSFIADSVTYYYPFKYKKGAFNLGEAPTEYVMVLRLAEQYLIRAEARTQQGDITGGINDLNIIRKRAHLSNTEAADKDALLRAVKQERRVELFTEWGHRWLDLKRTGDVNVVMSTITPMKGGSWNPNWQLYPIPQYDIQNNSNLKQNPGYN